MDDDRFISECERYTYWYTQIKPLYTNTCIVIFGRISSVFNLCIQTFFFTECLLKRINWELRLVWCSPDWGRGGTGSEREAQRWQSAPANGGWLPGPPEGPGGPSHPRHGLCLHCGTESGHMKRGQRVSWGKGSTKNRYSHYSIPNQICV